MTPYGHWLKVSKVELVTWYMNASVTGSCLGHSKGQANDSAVKEYLQLMEKYNFNWGWQSSTLYYRYY